LGQYRECLFCLGRAQKALECYEQALAAAQTVGNRRSESVSLDALGYLYQEWGEVRKALEYHERALAIAREIGDRQAIGHCLGHLGTAYYALGQPQQAIAYYAQVLAILYPRVSARSAILDHWRVF
jgi:tetratricopeptide (TPR) repeat protein